CSPRGATPRSSSVSSPAPPGSSLTEADVFFPRVGSSAQVPAMAAAFLRGRRRRSTRGVARRVSPVSAVRDSAVRDSAVRDFAVRGSAPRDVGERDPSARGPSARASGARERGDRGARGFGARAFGARAFGAGVIGAGVSRIRDLAIAALSVALLATGCLPPQGSDEPWPASAHWDTPGYGWPPPAGELPARPSAASTSAAPAPPSSAPS